MVSATKACLAPDAFLDADIINRLWQFYKLDGVSLKKFSKCIRKASSEQVDQFVLPFLHTLPAIGGRKGKAAKRAKSKAAVLIITKSDIHTLWTQLVQNGQTFKDFRRFIQRGDPSLVLKTIKRAVKSRKLNQLDARLRILIQNRAAELESIRGEESIEGASQRTMGDRMRNDEHESIDLRPIEKYLQRISENERPAVITIYQQALINGHTQHKAKKFVRRAVDPTVQSNDQTDAARLLYPTPESPEIALPVSLADVGIKTAVAEAVTQTSKKRKRDSETQQRLPDEPNSATGPVPKSPSALALDGLRDTYDIPVSSPSSRALSMEEFKHHDHTTNESEITQEPPAKKRKKGGHGTRKVRDKDVTVPEERFLQDNLGTPVQNLPGSTTKRVKAETPSSSTNAMEASKVVPTTPIEAKRRTLSDGSSEEDLLRESLNSTSRPRLFPLVPVDYGKTKHQPHPARAQMDDYGSSSLMIESSPQSSARAHKKRKRSSNFHDIVLTIDQLVAGSGYSGDSSKHTANHRLSMESDAMSTQSVDPSVKQSPEDALLLECLAKTARRSQSSNASYHSIAREDPPIQVTPDASILLSIEQSEPVLPTRMASQELGDPTISGPKKSSKKRRRLSPLELPELQLQGSDMLEVDESDYDAQGNKIEKPPTIKKRKKKNKHNTSRKNTPKEDNHHLFWEASFSTPNELPSNVRGDEGNPTRSILCDAFDRAVSLATDSLHILVNAGTQSLGSPPFDLHAVNPEALASLSQLSSDLLASNNMRPSSPVPSMDNDILATTPKRPRSAPVTPRKQTGKSSRFFTPSPTKKPRPSPGTISCIKAPPLSASTFGLIQEELASNPFQLLVAVIFLNRTRGAMAIPLFRKAIERYPTTESMSIANVVDIAALMQPLGLQNHRAATLVNLANIWVQNPPVKGWRFRTPSYPTVSTSSHIKADEVLADDDVRQSAFEIGHIPGLGTYAFDSWRIFCRDELRGLATSWNGEGADADFEPEWKRVLPKDKELRAFLRWMWLKEGWKWDPETGDKEVASEELMRKGEEGGLTFTDYEA